MKGLKYVYNVQDPHWSLYTDHCAPCLSNYTYIVDVDQENELAEMLRLTGLARMVEREDMEYIVNPTDGGSSAEVVVTYMEMLDCDEVEELASIYLPDMVMFNFTITSVLPPSMNCTF